jgi:uncharacterized protein YbjT (DUF2867 family)
MLGKPVLLQLAQNPDFSVTLGSRNRPLWLPQTVDWVKLDLARQDTMLAALQPGSYIYLNLSVDPRSKPTDFQAEREGVQNLLQAAKAKGVAHICYLASLIQKQTRKNGSLWWVFGLKEQAVTAIKESGIGYTIFYGSTFMETIPYRFLQKNTITLAGRLPFPSYWIAASDYARQVAVAFELAQPDTCKSYIVQGPQKLTMVEAVDKYTKTYNFNNSGRAIKQSRIPIGLLGILGLLSRKLQYIYELLKAFELYEEQPSYEATWEELGTPTTTIESFAQQQNSIHRPI